MSGFIETFRGVVAPWECDEFGHMNVQFYNARMSDGFWQLLIAMGLGPKVRREKKLGVVALDGQTTYAREVRAGELIRVESGILRVGEKSIQLAHRLLAGAPGQVAMTSHVKSVCFDLEARRSAPFPPEVRERITGLIVPTEPGSRETGE
ncbi:acyl-CoA thioesterase [Desertibaculum subflavum]|uniref:acyl-CoA thioesterase n=1 Tax=Desertibaculum subflavum TaxID=2268458 RepID=UPI000E66EA6F